jgi:hypothetical protein
MELERRKEERIKALRPPLIQRPNLDRLIKECEEYLDHIERHGRADDDHDHYIYESAMSTLYGERVWEFINTSMGVYKGA